MTFPDDRDSELEELLRTTLRGEADTISPAGDGLARIQQRVNVRRSRRLWLRPLAAVGAVAVVGGAGVSAYALTRPPHHSDHVQVISPQPTETPSTTPSPTPTATKPVLPAFPTAAFYPFTSAAAERSWENGDTSHSTWMLKPTTVAQLFVADFVQQPSVAMVVDSSTKGAAATVTLGRTLSDGSGQHVVPVTTVHLVRYGKAWLVTGAVDPNGDLRITSPANGSTISSPVTVTGPQYGVDESVAVDVRSLSGRDTIGGTKHASFGNGTPPWSLSVGFDVPQDQRGAVVAITDSAADGGPARITANGVTFSTATLVDYPKYFYGVKNGRVAKLASRNGATISYLTDAQAGGGASDPQLAGDRVFYLAGAGTCANTLRSVSVGGGQSDLVGTPEPGYVITSYAVSADTHELALFETDCAPSAARPQGLLVSSVRGTATSHTIAFQSFPPMVVGDPSWEPDGRHVDAVDRTGNSAGITRWDAFAAKSINDGSDACGDLTGAGLATAVDVDATGSAWVALQTGTSMDVVRCTGGTPTKMFTVAGNDSPQDLAVTANGRAVLLTDSAGKVWRWASGSTGPTMLSPTRPQPQVSW